MLNIINTNVRNPNLSKWNVLFDPPSQWLCFMPKEGLQVYPCYSCQDMFSSKSSFLDHVNRRGLLILYKCTNCSQKKSLTFYNPCAFLLHCRKHFNTLGEAKINLANVKITVIPFGLAGFPPHPNIPMIYDVEEDTLGRNTEINTKFYSPLPECKGREIVHFKATILLFHFTPTSNKPPVSLVLKQISTNIPHCEFVTVCNVNKDNHEMKKLYNSGENQLFIKAEECVVSETSVCRSKDVELPGSQTEEACNKTNPANICPECKETHVLTYHFSRNKKPCNDSLKCKVCKYEATSECSLSAHERIHTDSRPFVCPECGKSFEDSESLIAHAEDVCCHLAKQVRIKCAAKSCGKIFAHSDTYAAHLLVHMICFYGCKFCSIMSTNMDEFIIHRKLHNQTDIPEKLFKCGVCLSDETFTILNYKTHIETHITSHLNCVYVYICKNCRKFFRSRNTYTVHVKTCNKKFQGLEKQALLAVSCDNCKSSIKLPYGNISIAKCPRCEKGYCRPRSNQNIQSGNKGCALCNKQMNDEELKLHYDNQECIYMNPVVVVDKEVTSPKNSPSKPNNAIKKKRKRTIVLQSKNKKTAVTKTETTVEAQAEEPVPFDGLYKCSICDFSSENRPEFHEHVLIHRTISTSYQCMECGDCFVVKPSFSKHLLHFHQISDLDGYLIENNCFDRSAVEELSYTLSGARGEVNGAVKENQCKVCLKEFDSSFELKKHFRVHGAMFLKL